MQFEQILPLCKEGKAVTKKEWMNVKAVVFRPDVGRFAVLTRDSRLVCAYEFTTADLLDSTWEIVSWDTATETVQ